MYQETRSTVHRVRFGRSEGEDVRPVLSGISWRLYRVPARRNRADVLYLTVLGVVLRHASSAAVAKAQGLRIVRLSLLDGVDAARRNAVYPCHKEELR